MPFITFIYRIGNNDKTYYGKYCTDYVSVEHEGLDIEVRYRLLQGINRFRQNKCIRKLKSKQMKVGILSYSSDSFVPMYSTDKEIQCFDFYYDYNNNAYVNGKLV
jgi:hypothetical protein